MNKIEELKKGCGLNFIACIPKYGTIELQCGKWKSLPFNNNKLLWCALCAEKIIEEQDRIINKLTEEKKEQ